MLNINRFESMLTSVQAENYVSKANTFSLKSLNTLEVFEQIGELKQVTPNDGKVMVDEIVDGIFDRRKGMANISSSRCSISEEFRDSEEMDKRLKHWQDTLRDRARMQDKISRKTGRRPEEMLFNMPITVEQRDKGTIQRLMDYATRLNPITQKEKQYGVLPGHYNEEQCVCISEVRETVPRAERVGEANVEITGLTNTTKREILGSKHDVNSRKMKDRSKWLNSEVLEESIEQKAKDIKRVLEYFPDLDNLEVVGNNPLAEIKWEHDSDIDLVRKQSIFSISSITDNASLNEQKVEEKEEKEEKEEIPSSLLIFEPAPINIGLKINERTFIMNDRPSYNMEVKVYFECTPFDRQMKQVLRLENIGRRVLVCEWQAMDVHKRTLKVFNSCTACFYFNHSRVKILPGEVHVINVLFNPHTVFSRKQRWELKIFPNIFCSRRNSVILQMYGKCVPPPEYLQKINRQLRKVVDKANDEALKSLVTHQAELVPLITPDERVCPYERAFDDREVFNSLNVGYHCERFDDLEALRVLHNVLKLPREPPWDLRLETIKQLIMRMPEVKKRKVYFQIFLGMQEPLFCSTDAALTRFEHNSERERSRLIYVRGCIGNGIEEWEDLMLSLEQSCFKSELALFYAQLAKESKPEEHGSSDEEETKPWRLQLKYRQPEVSATWPKMWYPLSRAPSIFSRQLCGILADFLWHLKWLLLL
ncbi:uncharacterized protein [Drosophila virilis]|uniref:uncharacterized protein isoform X2 n=1 Tax=Drosophila virilis TaxID=7244 RepID=UPI00139662CC|nr:uncharacterized protein LOC6636512 isoform X2 [Drosophila virilis]